MINTQILTVHGAVFVSNGPIGSSGVSVSFVWADSVTIGIFCTIYEVQNNMKSRGEKKSFHVMSYNSEFWLIF